MPRAADVLELENKIEASRIHMVNLAYNKGRHHIEVIRSSQELDKLINEYYQS